MRQHVDVDVTVRMEGNRSREKEYLERRVREAAAVAPGPVLFARAVLEGTGNPAVEQHAVASANLDVNGTIVRAEATGTTAYEAADRLKDRIRHELRHLADRRIARRQRGTSTAPGEWRHGDLVEERPGHYPRPEDERAVVPRTSRLPAPARFTDALTELDRRENEFVLYRDADTAGDLLLVRDPDASLRLVVAGGDTPGDVPDEVGIELGAPAMDLTKATRTLDDGALPFVFFVDDATDRAAVLYHRDDGHYGLVRSEG